MSSCSLHEGANELSKAKNGGGELWRLKFILFCMSGRIRGDTEPEWVDAGCYS